MLCVAQQELCERLRFPGETAASVHSEIYKQKLESFLEKKSLTDKDEEELLRLRVLLCIPEATVTAAHRERCGAIFRETLELALSSGIDGFSSVLCDKVVKVSVARSLRARVGSVSRRGVTEQRGMKNVHVPSCARCRSVFVMGCVLALTGGSTGWSVSPFVRICV